MKAERNKTIDMTAEAGKEYLSRCLTLEDLEDAGMSLDDLVDQSMGQLNPEDLVPADDMSGSYAVDGDKIIINGQNENYFTRVGDTLVLSADGIEIVFTKR